MLLRVALYITIFFACCHFSSCAAEDPDFGDFGNQSNRNNSARSSGNTPALKADHPELGEQMQFANQFGEAALKKLTDWSERAKVSEGITPRDAVNNSDKTEMYALRKFLARFVTYQEPANNDPQKHVLNRKFRYYKDMKRIAEKLNDRGWSSQHVSVKQLMKLRAEGWNNLRNDQLDTLIVRDLLYYLQDEIRKLGGVSKAPFLHLVRSRLIFISELALRAQARNQTDLEIMDRWVVVKSAREPLEILKFPWSEIASRQPGMGHFAKAFEYVMTISNYLQLTYRQYFSVETILWFSSNEKMLEGLNKLASVEAEVDLIDQESKYGAQKGRLTISELVRFTRRIPEFRELSKMMYDRYLDALTNQSLIKSDALAMQLKVSKIAHEPSISSLINVRSEEEVKLVFDEFRKGPDLHEKFEPLLKIQSVQGFDFPESQKREFHSNTGLDFERVLETRGDKIKLEQLIRNSYPEKAADPQFMKNTTSRMTNELDRISKSENLTKVMEAAENREIANKVLGQKEGGKYFEVQGGKLVLKREALNQVKQDGAGVAVEAAGGAFNDLLSSTQKNLDRADDLSIDLRHSSDQINYIEKELAELGEPLENSSSGEIGNEVSQWKTQLSNEHSLVKEGLIELKSHQNRFESARSQLASLLGLKANELQGDKQRLNEAIQEHLKGLAFQNENLSSRISVLLEVLGNLRDSAQAIDQISAQISQSRAKVSKIQGNLTEYIQQLKIELPRSNQRQKLLKQRHREIYRRTAYHSDSEKQKIAEYASMTAEFDENFANQYAGKYLTGFIQKGDTKDNFIESIKFHSFTEQSISFDLTLVNIRENDNWEKVTDRKIVTLVVRPRVVRNQENNFDFEIVELKMNKEGAQPEQLDTEFQLVLDSTVQLLNNVVKSLNDTPYEKLRFKYFAHLETLRAINALPIFESFPNFKVDLIQMAGGKIKIYGDVSGEKLGHFVGKELASKRTKQSQESKISSKFSQNGGKYKQLLKQSSGIVGRAQIRVNQVLINDFYKGIRAGVIATKSDEQSENSLARFFEGLETASIAFKEDQKINLFMKGDLTLISPETKQFYNIVRGISEPYLGLKESLARAGSGFLSFVTFGKVKVEVDPSKYDPPSGKFAVFLSGQSKFNLNKLQLDFEEASLYDPVNVGALQPYLGTAKVVLSVTRAVGWLYEKLIGLIDKLPGVNFKVSADRLDHVLLTWLTGTLATHLDEGIDDVSIRLRAFNAYDVELKSMQLIDGVSTTLDNIQVIHESIEISSETTSHL